MADRQTIVQFRPTKAGYQDAESSSTLTTLLSSATCCDETPSNSPPCTPPLLSPPKDIGKDTYCNDKLPPSYPVVQSQSLSPHEDASQGTKQSHPTTWLKKCHPSATQLNNHHLHLSVFHLARGKSFLTHGFVGMVFTCVTKKNYGWLNDGIIFAAQSMLFKIMSGKIFGWQSTQLSKRVCSTKYPHYLLWCRFAHFPVPLGCSIKYLCTQSWRLSYLPS